jgi:hypothetical protein
MRQIAPASSAARHVTAIGACRIPPLRGFVHQHSPPSRYGVTAFAGLPSRSQMQRADEGWGE